METSTVGIRIADSFLEDLDTTREALVYQSRTGYIRDIFRDPVKHPEFARTDPQAIAASGVDIQEGRTYGSDEVMAECGLDGQESWAWFGTGGIGDSPSVDVSRIRSASPSLLSRRSGTQR